MAETNFQYGISFDTGNSQKNIEAVNKGLEQTNKAVQSVGASSARMQGNMGGVTSTMMAFNNTLRDSPYFMVSANMGIMSISNNLPMLIDGFVSVTKQAGGLRGAMSLLGSTLMGPMGISVGFSLLMGAIQVFSMANAKKEIKETGDAAEQTTNRLTQLREQLEKYKVASIQEAFEKQKEYLNGVKKSIELLKAERDELVATQQERDRLNAKHKSGQTLYPWEMLKYRSEDNPAYKSTANRIKQLNEELANYEKNIKSVDNSIGQLSSVFKLYDIAINNSKPLKEWGATAKELSQNELKTLTGSLEEHLGTLKMNTTEYKNLKAVLDELKKSMKEEKSGEKKDKKSEKDSLLETDDELRKLRSRYFNLLTGKLTDRERKQIEEYILEIDKKLGETARYYVSADDINNIKLKPGYDTEAERKKKIQGVPGYKGKITGGEKEQTLEMSVLNATTQAATESFQMLGETAGSAFADLIIPIREANSLLEIMARKIAEAAAQAVAMFALKTALDFLGDVLGLPFLGSVAKSIGGGGSQASLRNPTMETADRLMQGMVRQTALNVNITPDLRLDMDELRIMFNKNVAMNGRFS